MVEKVCLAEPGVAEFDAYAENYNAGMDNSILRLAGGSADNFIELKVRWLLKDARAIRFCKQTPSPRGCLTMAAAPGTFFAVLRRLGFPGTLQGCDLSPAMIAQARKTWQGTGLPLQVLARQPRCPMRTDRLTSS